MRAQILVASPTVSSCQTTGFRSSDPRSMRWRSHAAATDGQGLHNMRPTQEVLRITLGGKGISRQ